MREILFLIYTFILMILYKSYDIQKIKIHKYFFDIFDD